MLVGGGAPLRRASIWKVSERRIHDDRDTSVVDSRCPASAASLALLATPLAGAEEAALRPLSMR